LWREKTINTDRNISIGASNVKGRKDRSKERKNEDTRV